MLFKNRKILKAAKKGDLELFKKCLAEGVDNKIFGKALLSGISEGHEPVIKICLEEPQFNSLSNEIKNNCLRSVCAYGELTEEVIIPIADTFLGCNANINYCDSFGDSVLSDTSARGDREKIVQFLIDRGADTTIKNRSGNLAWERAKGVSKTLFPEYKAHLLKESRIVAEEKKAQQTLEQDKKIRSALKKGGLSWAAEQKDYVSCTEYLKNTNRSICEIFNFRTKQIITVNCNLKTDSESSFETDFSKYIDRDRLAQACDVANENGQNVDKNVILNLELKMVNGHLGHKMKIKVPK